MIEKEKTWLFKYREAIKNGEIQAGQELIMQLDNLIKDLENPRYIYDTSEAYRRIDFIENCIRLTKSPFYGKPMILMLWQKAFIEVIYSFKMADTGFDRFKKVILLIGRKNTKSETCSALMLTEMIMGNPGSDIVASSNDDTQANILYDAVDVMRKMIDPDQKDTWRNQMHIRNKLTNSKIFKLSDKTRNKEGRNIDLAVIDECYRGDTEILTNTGFKRLDNLSENDLVAQWDNGEITFVKPTRYIKRECKEGLVKNNLGHGRSLYTTPRHNIVYEHKGKIGCFESRESRTQGYIPLTGKRRGGIKQRLTDYDRVLIATQADGSLHYRQSEKRSTQNSRANKGQMFLIAFKKQKKIERFLSISKCLKDVKEINSSRKEYRRFTYILDTDKAKRLDKCFNLEDMSCEYAKDFVEEISKWDGYTDKDGRIYYSSVVKENSDFVAAVGMLAGYSIKCSVMLDNRSEKYNTIYRVVLQQRKLSCRTFNAHKEFIDYRGTVYCVEVPSKKIVIRSEGMVLICGNCHEQKEPVILKSIEQSQSLKDNPKLIIISTEGFVNDGTLDQLLVDCRRIINGEENGIAAERTLPWLYTQDSEQEIWQDEASWQKSNPTLGIVKKWDYLREQIDLASRNKADRVFVLSKDFNIKQSNSQAWLLSEDYKYEAKFNIEDFKDSVVLGAVDLAETTDLTCAKILLMKPNDNTKYVYTQYFIPESKLENSPDFSSGASYLEWAKNGYLKICEGNENDLSVVADWFYEIYKKYNIRLLKCGYDQRFAKDFLNRMDYYGFECEMVYQNKQTLSNPMKLLEADLKSQSINYNENPIDQWCFGNASVEVDNFGQCMAVKINNQAAKRIDGAVTTIILYEMYRRYRSEFNQYVNR